MGGETTGTDKQPPEAPITPPSGTDDAAGYEDVAGGETSPQSGAGDTASKEQADG